MIPMTIPMTILWSKTQVMGSATTRISRSTSNTSLDAVRFSHSFRICHGEFGAKVMPRSNKTKSWSNMTFSLNIVLITLLSRQHAESVASCRQCHQLGTGRTGVLRAQSCAVGDTFRILCAQKERKRFVSRHIPVTFFRRDSDLRYCIVLSATSQFESVRMKR